MFFKITNIGKEHENSLKLSFFKATLKKELLANMGENLKILREAYNPDRGYMLLILIGQPSVYAFLVRSNLDSTARGANSQNGAY